MKTLKNHSFIQASLHSIPNRGLVTWTESSRPKGSYRIYVDYEFDAAQKVPNVKWCTESSSIVHEICGVIWLLVTFALTSCLDPGTSLLSLEIPNEGNRGNDKKKASYHLGL
jgi:hypothetical protein